MEGWEFVFFTKKKEKEEIAMSSSRTRRRQKVHIKYPKRFSVQDFFDEEVVVGARSKKKFFPFLRGRMEWDFSDVVDGFFGRTVLYKGRQKKMRQRTQ